MHRLDDRLTEAARKLANGAPDILAIALEAGYGSHEAFTRAFREQFAVTPESVRDRRSIEDLALVQPPELRTKADQLLDAPRFVDEECVRVVGLSEPCSFDSTIGIPAQWQRFMPYYEAIGDKVDSIPVGVSHAADDEGEFQYLCGVQVARFNGSPRELLKLEIPPRTYAVFQHRGHVCGLTQTYRTIWNEALPALDRRVADAPALERHNPTFDPRSGEGGLALWIPLAN